MEAYDPTIRKFIHEVVNGVIREAQRFADALEVWLGDLWDRLPCDGWREDLDRFIAAWAEQGIVAEPDDVRDLKLWIIQHEKIADASRPVSGPSVPRRTLLEFPRAASALVPIDSIKDEIPTWIREELLHLGRIIMRTSPPDQWLARAERASAGMPHVPSVAKEQFIKWIEEEQRNVLQPLEWLRQMREAARLTEAKRQALFEAWQGVEIPLLDLEKMGHLPDTAFRRVHNFGSWGYADLAARSVWITDFELDGQNFKLVWAMQARSDGLGAPVARVVDVVPLPADPGDDILAAQPFFKRIISGLNLGRDAVLNAIPFGSLIYNVATGHLEQAARDAVTEAAFAGLNKTGFFIAGAVIGEIGRKLIRARQLLNLTKGGAREIEGLSKLLERLNRGAKATTGEAKRFLETVHRAADEIRQLAQRTANVTMERQLKRLADELEADALRAIHGHHSDAIFLGGERKQELTDLLTFRHKQLHNDLNEFLRSKENALGQHMRPQPGNSGQKIRRRFSRAERLEAEAEFYRIHRHEYPDAARDFFQQHPDLE